MTVANVYTQQVLLRRGNTSSASTYTGPVGEAIIDTDLHTLRVQDGVTPGGYLIATEGYVNNTLANIPVANIDLSSYATISYVQSTARTTEIGRASCRERV